MTVYLECRAKHQKAAKDGALDMLKYLSTEWFNDPKLLIENRYRDAFS